MVAHHPVELAGEQRGPQELDIESPAAELAKVNPPIRPRADVEFLWSALLAGELDWVVSDLEPGGGC